MADPELIKDIRPYVEFILSKEEKKIKRISIAKGFREASTAEQDENNDIIMTYLLELTEKYPEYEYDKVIEKLKSGELTLPAGGEEVLLLNSGREENEEESGQAESSNSNSSEEEEEEEEEENENEENSSLEASSEAVTPDEKEGIAKPAIVRAAQGGPAIEAMEGCKKGLPVKAKSTLAQGDCFYSSIYRSAGEGGLLEQINECLGVEIEHEDDFIDSMRGVVAARVLAGQLPSDPSNPGQDTFDILVEQIHGGLWSEVLKAYPAWFVADYKKGLPVKERFLEKFAARVATRKLMVSQIEVTMVENALETCGIKINKHNHDVARGVPGALNLWNQGEYHWVYFSFDVPVDYEQTEEFLKKEYEDCQRECRSIKLKLDAEKGHQAAYLKHKQGKNPTFEKRKGRIYMGGGSRMGTPPVGSRKKYKKRRITKKKK